MAKKKAQEVEATAEPEILAASESEKKSVTAFVREIFNEGVFVKPKAILDELTRRGIEAKIGNVNQALNKIRKESGGGGVSKKRIGASASGSSIGLDDLKTLGQLAKNVGGFGQLKAVIDAMEGN